MASRRMFSLHVVDTDKFIDMSVSARLLYYELGMRADDDGFISSPLKIIRSVGCSTDDLKLLIAKGYVISFDSGIIVIRHWKMNNYIQKDRYNKTIYQDEAKTLSLTDSVYNSDTDCIQTVYTGKDRIGKDIIHSRASSTSYASEIKEIVDYLNQAAGTTYRDSTKNTIKHITARLKEGYTVAEIKTVIDSKVKEWSCTDYQKYLRPDTLFGSKFESYLNVVTAQSTNSGIDSMYAGYAPAYRGGDVG